MADLLDPEGEMDLLVKDILAMGPKTTREQGDLFIEKLADARQAHRPWADSEWDAVMKRGSQARFKHHLRRSGLVTAKVKRGKKTIDVDLATIVGIRELDGWHQKPIGELTPAQYAGYVHTRTTARDRATQRLEPLRRIAAIVKEYPSAASVGEALTLAGTSLVEVLEGAS